MGRRILATTAVVAASAVVAVLVGRARESSRAARLVDALLEGMPRNATARVDFATFTDLPLPVARYFRHVLTDGQSLVEVARMQQSGELRTSTAIDDWMEFSACQTIVPPAVGFVWNARIRTPFATHVRVLDSYAAGVGSGRASLLSTVALASEAGAPELNSGALHRYLAEAVWCPTALLPESGVAWSPIDDHSALATLCDRGTTVSLKFRFNDIGEVTGIFSDGRFGRFDGVFRRVPWQGRFREYHEQSGMRVPRYGEVGWHVDGVLELVWKGRVISARYEPRPACMSRHS